MKIKKRHQLILQLLTEQGKITVNELSEKAQVSVVTIRHDLNFLEEHNYLKREHGVAVLLDVDKVDDRIRLNFSLKQQLAQLAATLVAPGDTVFIEGGSSNALLARALSHQKEILIVTCNLYIAELLKNANADVVLLGGLLQAKSENMVGPLTKQAIKQVHFNKAFIGTDGFHPDYGFTGRDMMRADVINAVLDKNVENIIIADSSKFGLVFPYSLQPSDAIKTIVTDAYITPEQRIDFKKINIHIMNL